MIEDKLTIKEMQTYNFLHTLRKEAEYAKVEITLHGHDFAGIEVKFNKSFDGQDRGLDKMKLLLTSMFGE